jgi:hypothetical protein
MTDTARALIADCLKELGVLAKGEQPEDQDAQDALLRLNELLETWSIETLTVFRIGQITHAFVAGQGTYTIGEAGGEDVSTARPTAVLRGSFVRDGDGYDHPLTVLGARQDFDSIVLKSTQNDYPGWVWYDPAWPSGTLHYYGVPRQIWTAHLNVPAAFTAFEDLDSAVSFPPGYSRMLRTNGALELASMFDAEPTAALVAAATDSKEKVRRLNLSLRQKAPHFPRILRQRRARGVSAARVIAGDY